MSTKIQWLRVIFKSFNAYIKQTRKILLLAAVFLFVLSCTVFAPLLNVERIVFSVNDKGQDTYLNSITEKPRCASKVYSLGGNYQKQKDDNRVLASAGTETDTEITKQKLIKDQKLASIRGNSFLISTQPITFISQEPRQKIVNYVVKEGDTSSSIAASFGISLDTLLWANDLNESSLIRPGDELTILPITGLLHKVKSNETISEIADKYDANAQKIIEFNTLPADGKISIGEKLIVPDGEMPAPVSPKPKRIASRSYSSTSIGKQGHQFPYGQCTWYVSQRRYVPWSGHAKQWLYNARAMGYKTGSTPQVGAIIVTKESWYGHVGYVEAVKGNWVTFSEMNHLGWAIKSVRTIHKDNYKIRGYIY